MDPSYVSLYVIPRSRTQGFEIAGETVRVRVSAAPDKGSADAAVIAILADALGIGRAAVRIVSGETARRKLVAVDGMTAAMVLNRLRAATEKAG